MKWKKFLPWRSLTHLLLFLKIQYHILAFLSPLVTPWEMCMHSPQPLSITSNTYRPLYPRQQSGNRCDLILVFLQRVSLQSVSSDIRCILKHLSQMSKDQQCKCQSLSSARRGKLSGMVTVSQLKLARKSPEDGFIPLGFGMD